MRSFWLETQNGRSTVALRETATPEPGPYQALVRVQAAGLNRGELIPGHALHGTALHAKPLGMEAAGDVLAVGDLVHGISVGDRIMGRCSGAFAEFALVDTREAMPIPESLSWETAAAIPIAYMVAYDMLIIQGKLSSQDTLFIAGASSGVGVACLQIAKALGARVIGTSGSDEKLDRLASVGLDVGIRTRKPDFADAVIEATEGEGVNLVVNTVGGSVFDECMQCLAFEGRFATVGYVDGQLSSSIDIGLLHARRLVLFGVSSKMRPVADRAELAHQFSANIVPLIDKGVFTPPIEKIFPFESLSEAVELMSANRHVGKIVLKMSS